MKSPHAIICLFAMFLASSCATTPPQQYSPEPLSNQNGTISDGYTTTTVHNKMGASSSIEHEKTVMTLDNYLRGLAGVNVRGSGSTAAVTVRGIGSFTASNEPLFIINGTQIGSYSAAYNMVSPNDIKRVTVLTDASSTSIYGVRGANGVVVITLKNTK